MRPTVAFANARAMDSVVVEGPEAEGDDELESIIVHSRIVNRLASSICRSIITTAIREDKTRAQAV